VTVSSFYGYLLGLFPVNLVHLAIGAWGIVAYTRGTPSSRMFARGPAVLYGILAVMGFIPGFNVLFGLVPLYGHDVWLHALTAVLAAYSGWIHRVDVGDGVRERTGDLIGRH
jgi:hypothetical protein